MTDQDFQFLIVNNKETQTFVRLSLCIKKRSLYSPLRFSYHVLQIEFPLVVQLPNFESVKISKKETTLIMNNKCL